MAGNINMRVKPAIFDRFGSAPSPRAGLPDEAVIAGLAVVEVLEKTGYLDHAPTLHSEVIDRLRREAFEVYPEYPTVGLGDVRKGRVDILAVRDGGHVAIELDCRRPKRRSIFKLLLFDAFRVIGIRGISGFEIPEIDACVCMPVRCATQAQKQDRRIYRPAADIHDDWNTQ